MLQGIINTSDFIRDAELSVALNDISKDPKQLQRYLQDTQTTLYKDVVQTKDDVFQKVYGDLERAGTANNSILYYKQRNADLTDLQKQVYDKQRQGASAIEHDKDLSKRQYEINQWSFYNKLDTLFVYQLIFIGLCTVAVLTYLHLSDILPQLPYYILSGIIFLIVVFTIINRERYNKKIRDNRYWNKQNITIPSTGLTPTPSPSCQDDSIIQDMSVKSPLDFIQSSFATMAQKTDENISTMSSSLSSATTTTQTGIKSLEKDIMSKL
jgi:hypothetical protein